MSTKAIREVLGDAGFGAPDTCDEAMARKVAAAWAELERIESASKALMAMTDATSGDAVLDMMRTFQSVAEDAP